MQGVSYRESRRSRSRQDVRNGGGESSSSLRVRSRSRSRERNERKRQHQQRNTSRDAFQDDNHLSYRNYGLTAATEERKHVVTMVSLLRPGDTTPCREIVWRDVRSEPQVADKATTCGDNYWLVTKFPQYDEPIVLAAARIEYANYNIQIVEFIVAQPFRRHGVGSYLFNAIQCAVIEHHMPEVTTYGGQWMIPITCTLFAFHHESRLFWTCHGFVPRLPPRDPACPDSCSSDASRMQKEVDLYGLITPTNMLFRRLPSVTRSNVL